MTMYYVTHRILAKPIPAMEWTGDVEELIAFLGGEPLEWVDGNPRVRTIATTPVVQVGWTLYRYPNGIIASASGAQHEVYERV